MAHIEDDFAAYTTIGDRVEPSAASSTRRAASSAPQGPKFGVASKLEPFALLAKSARGAGAASLFGQAISAPGVYVFSELLHHPNIRDIAVNEQYGKQYRLLELFAHGTWTDYKSAPDQYPSLSPEQEIKLKQLTILSLASENRILPYETLLSTLDIDTVPRLEDLLIESIYSNILVAKLDQKALRLEILSSLGRDVQREPSSRTSSSATMTEIVSSEGDSSMQQPQLERGVTTTTPSIDSLLSSLHSWQSKIDHLLTSLDRHMATLQAQTINHTQRSIEQEQRVRDMVTFVAANQDGKNSKLAGGGAGKSREPSWTNAGSSTRGATSRGDTNPTMSRSQSGIIASQGRGDEAGFAMEVDSDLMSGGLERNDAGTGGGGGTASGHRARKRGRN
ncbi:PCI domain-containing protein [Sporobolomyces koalae]|uniref:PCI domain-containing protein n=1 Tax=Sporobolomyces koalae TaxID=500713 RepID=UPI00317E0BE3